MKTISKYNKPEKNCGDRLKVLNIQTWDMCNRHNLQVYEILSVIKSTIEEVESETVYEASNRKTKAPDSGSSCGDDFKTVTKYKGPEHSLGSCIEVCRYQIRDMFILDGLTSKTIYNLIKDLVEYHIHEIDELD